MQFKSNDRSSVSFTVSGNVKADGVNLAGATVKLIEANATRLTDANGNFSYTVAEGNSVTISVYRDGVTFAPSSVNFGLVTEDRIVNFQSGVALCADCLFDRIGF